MTTPRPSLNVAELSSIHSRLLAAKKKRRLDAHGAAALAECCFRMALSGQRPLLEQIQLLQESVRLDGTNPKFAYHLARLYCLAGNFDAAAQWLRMAVELCPTSHRLWTHVSLLQRELNARYFGNEKFEPNALRGWAETIEAAVASGSDHFDRDLLEFQPPVSRATLEEQARKAGNNGAPHSEPREKKTNNRQIRRIARPNSCRWWGIHALRIEAQLQAAPTKQRLQGLLEPLDLCAKACFRRPGGAASFGILGVLWVLAGYPAASVVRIAAIHGANWAGPSRELFDTVARLVELPGAALPAALAAALRDKTVPPLLVALIHNRRLLSPIPELRNLAAVRAARRLLADPRPEREHAAEATDLAQKLLNALEAFRPKPSEPLEDIIPEAGAAVRQPAELIADFEKLEATAPILIATMGNAFAILKSDVAARATAATDAASAEAVRSDVKLAEEIVAGLMDASAAGLQRVESACQALFALQAAPEDLAPRREECIRCFTTLSQLGNFTRLLQRVRGKVSALPQGQAAPGSPDLQQHLSTIASFVKAPAGNSASTLEQARKNADDLTAAADRDWIRVKHLVRVHAQNQPPLTAEERAEPIALRGRLKQTFATAKQAIEALISVLAGGALPDADRLAAEEAKARLTSLYDRERAFSRNLSKLPVDEIPAAAKEQDHPPPENRTGLTGLRLVLEYAEREIARVFAALHATFEPYPARMIAPAMRDLRYNLRAREAELWYRFGRHERARRMWLRLRREDVLDPALLRNLAVCDSVGGRGATALSAWRGLLDIYYFFDFVEDDLRPRAANRKELHRGLAHANSPGALLLSHEEFGTWYSKNDFIDLIAFLSSPVAVRQFVGHKLLEFFNARLNVNSNRVLLGISQADNPAVRKQSVAKWREFQERIAGLLPSRVRAWVLGIVTRRMEEAIAICDEPQRLSVRHDSTYAADHDHLNQLIVDFSTTRCRLARMLIGAKDLAGQLTSFSGLIELLKLDFAPTDASPGFFEAAAGALSESPEQLLTILTDYAQQFVVGALQFAIDDPTDDSDGTRRRQVFDKMIEQIVPHERLQDVVGIIDNPCRVRTLVKKWTGEDGEATLEFLRSLHARFPSMAGAALHLAVKLLQAARDCGPDERQAMAAEAIAALETGCVSGFYENSISDCAQQLAALLTEKGEANAAADLIAKYRDKAQSDKSRAALSRMHSQLRFRIAVDHERFDEAIAIGLELLELDDHDDKIARNVLGLFEQAAQRTRKDPGVRSMRAAVADWAQRAEHRWNQHHDNLNENALSLEKIEQVRTQLDECHVRIAMHLNSDEDGAPDALKALEALTALIQEWPEIAFAYYHRMKVRMILAEDGTDEAERTKQRQAARADALEVVERSKNPEQVREAKKLLDDNS